MLIGNLSSNSSSNESAASKSLRKHLHFVSRTIRYMRSTRPFIFLGLASLAISPLLAAFVGSSIGSGILHPLRLNGMRLEETQEMLARTGAAKEDFSVRAQDAI